MKKKLLLLFAIALTMTAFAAENKVAKAKFFMNMVAQAIHVTTQTSCGTIVKYDYTPKEGMTEEQIDNEITLVNYVIDKSICPPTYYV